MIRNEEQPSYHITLCLIQIWNGSDPENPLKEPQFNECRLIAECENIEIMESYKQLIGTATVKFPRGTVIHQTITQENLETSKVSVQVGDDGAIYETRTDSKRAETSDFAVGQRIRIMLGYTTDPKVSALTKVDKTGKSIYNDSNKYTEFKNHLETMFEGYITKVSLDTPIELRCENLASRLKRKSCPQVPVKKNYTVNDFLADDGQYKLLEGTGIKLHPQSKSYKYNIGKVGLYPELTVADVLAEWAKYNLYSYVVIEDATAYLVIGRPYFTNAKKDSVFVYGASRDVPDIDFGYHVASNDLKLKDTDKKYLAIEASGLTNDDKWVHATIRRNPQWSEDQPTDDKYQVLNETELSKKAMKLGARPYAKKGTKEKVDLKEYNVRPYHSNKIGITKDELIEEAIKFFEAYNENGIEGNLTLFGDLHLQTAAKVHLTDPRQPQKNGYYYVEEVHTTFGVNGYRQTISLPYCVGLDKQLESNE